MEAKQEPQEAKPKEHRIKLESPEQFGCAIRLLQLDRELAVLSTKRETVQAELAKIQNRLSSLQRNMAEVQGRQMAEVAKSLGHENCVPIEIDVDYVRLLEQKQPPLPGPPGPGGLPLQRLGPPGRWQKELEKGNSDGKKEPPKDKE